MGETFGLLFARPSFLEGAARVLDLGDTLTEYNQSLTPEQAEYLALRSDWEVLGRDLERAILTVAEQIDQDSARGAQG